MPPVPLAEGLHRSNLDQRLTVLLPSGFDKPAVHTKLLEFVIGLSNEKIPMHKEQYPPTARSSIRGDLGSN